MSKERNLYPGKGLNESQYYRIGVVNRGRGRRGIIVSAFYERPVATTQLGCRGVCRQRAILAHLGEGDVDPEPSLLACDFECLRKQTQIKRSAYSRRRVRVAFEH